MSPRGRTTPLQYPIRVVARMSGISIDTLRAWERRYSAVRPARDDRGRLYSDADVARLQKLGELVRRGHVIGTIAGLDDRELGRLLAGEDRHRSSQTSPAETADLAPLTSALDRYDLDTIEAALNRYAAVLSPRDLVFAVIVPLLQDIGRRWEAGRLRPAQEHLVSSIVRSVLGGLLRASARPNASPRIIFATPAGERHELGLLSAALLAASAGYGVVYLGPDLPAAEIADAAATGGSRIVMVSLTMPGAVTRAEIRRLADLPRGTELWVGGPAAEAVLAAAGRRTRLVRDLADVVPMLSAHAH
ncbi:MAG TPA: MerR family transcriptional regulator [Vicinamibacterales bacterium]|nr:MerR family transcriptional regulator [Vicinamibacterales bacterium]